MHRIMIIDDDPEMIENVKAIMEDGDIEIFSRETTEGAVEELLAEKPELLILDVMFPENPAAGFDLARAIRNEETLKDMPVILLTGINTEFPMDFSSNDIHKEWMPVQKLMEKPVKLTELRDAVFEILDD